MHQEPGPFERPTALPQAGHIRALPSGRSLKAYCRWPGHPSNCSLFIDIKLGFANTVNHCIAWLAEGQKYSKERAHEHNSFVPDLQTLSNELGLESS